MRLINLKLVTAILLTIILLGCSDSADTINTDALNTRADTDIDAGKITISVIDFTGEVIELATPASKIIALAPHIVENAFTAGAGGQLIGAVNYSNYPEQANQLPIVGGYTNTNLEKIIELNPDLVIAWESGNSTSSITRLKELGYPVYMDQPDTLEDIAKSIQDIGTLAGTSEVAKVAADEYLSKIKQVRQQTQGKKLVTTFYQVWNRPLQTINGKHFISAAIELCGGENIYASESIIAPIINIESILDRNPEAIIASGMSTARPEWLDDWRQWPSLSAVQKDNLFFVNPDHIQRHTVRLLKGIDVVCKQLDIARERASN